MEGREREGGEREARETERERDERLHSPLTLHASPHTLGYIVGRDQVGHGWQQVLACLPLSSEFCTNKTVTARL
jgi:hypothetical protein